MRRRRVGTNNQPQLKEVRAVVLGQDGVGKSALTVRFLTRRFIGEYDSCLESTQRHYLTVDSHFIALDILDTAGKNSKEKIDAALLNANLIFLLYSTTSRESFVEARWISRTIQESRNLLSNAVIITIATKSDLKHRRKVHEYEGLFLAQDLECKFFQISISEGYKETQDILVEGIKLFLNKDLEKGRTSTLTRVKEGLKETAKSLRKKSSTENFYADHKGHNFPPSTNV